MFENLFEIIWCLRLLVVIDVDDERDEIAHIEKTGELLLLDVEHRCAEDIIFDNTLEQRTATSECDDSCNVVVIANTKGTEKNSV
jgi:hypothetical protein